MYNETIQPPEMNEGTHISVGGRLRRVCRGRVGSPTF